MEWNPKQLNRQQTELRRALTRAEAFDTATRLFLHQHALLHSAKMAQTEPWSFEDEILDDMTSAQMRRIPPSTEHSVAWCCWHIARIEDVAMNMLVASSPQVFSQSDWPDRLRVRIPHTGNAMAHAAIADLSARIDLEALRAYRVAVGRRTREIVRELEQEALKQKVDRGRLQKVLDEGAVVGEASGVVEYWSRRDIAGLLLMPATRHNLVHLNEALRLKKRRG